MNTGDQPAFPVIDSTGMDINVAPGLTKRELFSSNAPEVPEWFEHEKTKYKGEETPYWSEIENEDDRKLCRSWVHDGCFDLPDHLEWFQSKFEKSVADRNKWELENKKARYFQWRTFYADALIAELNRDKI